MANDLFDQFWAAYPRHVAKQDAKKAWNQIAPTPELVEIMLDALAWQCRQPAWTKDGGAFVPHPATWLRGGRWEDEPFEPMADEAQMRARRSPFEQARHEGLKKW